MGETQIGWTATRLADGTILPGYTFNPWLGCQRVSPACENCYAEWFAGNRMGYRDDGAKGFRLWGPVKGGARRVRTSTGYWSKPLTWNRKAAASGVRRKVFCASMADVFEAPGGDAGADLDNWRAELWPLIEATPQLDWLLLTKRPENILGMLPPAWRRGLPRNIWMGVTAESQEQAEARVVALQKVPARIHWLSVEPMVGAVDLDLPRCDTHGRDGVQASPDGEFCNECAAGGYSGELSYGHWLDPVDENGEPLNGGINWVVVGGESGPGHRALNMDHARALIQQCIQEGVPVFVKQDSGALPGQRGRFTAGEWSMKQSPESAR